MPAGGGRALSSRRWIAVAATAALAACLPSGTPPLGRHLVNDRTLSGVFLSPSGQDGVPAHVLASGPLARLDYPDRYGPQALADLYRMDDFVAAGPADGMAGQIPVAPAALIPYADATIAWFASDSLGRLFTFQAPAQTPPAFTFEFWRHELVAGGTAQHLADLDLSQNLASGRLIIMSPTRTRVFVGDANDGYLIGVADARRLGPVGAAFFVGEDFYCVSTVTSAAAGTAPENRILRVSSAGEAEVLLSSGADLGFVPIVGDFAPQLLLTLHGDMGIAPFALFDTDKRISISLPPEKGAATFRSASPDGHFLLFAEELPGGDPQQAQYRLFIYEWAKGAFLSLDAGVVGKPLDGGAEWRPGGTELWFTTLPDGFATWSPAGGVASYDGRLATIYSSRLATFFSGDGRHWFSAPFPHPQGPPRLYVGQADDPRAALMPLTPSDAYGRYFRDVGDGRIVIETWLTDPDRCDIYLVDADAGTTRALGGAGQVVAVGATRALVLLDWQLSRASGQLALVDFASGAQTVLAEDVYAVDLDASAAGTDRLAVGTRVAFLTRNRLASDYDGLWVAELP